MPTNQSEQRDLGLASSFHASEGHSLQMGPQQRRQSSLLLQTEPPALRGMLCKSDSGCLWAEKSEGLYFHTLHFNTPYLASTYLHLTNQGNKNPVHNVLVKSAEFGVRQIVQIAI